MTEHLNHAERPTMHYAYGKLGTLDGDCDGLPGLVSAGVAYRNPNGEDEFTVHVPDFDPLMVDSGGFQAATRWGSRAGVPTTAMEGRFPYSPKELHEWAEEIGADTVAGMDVACEYAQEIHKAGEPWPGDYKNRMLESLNNQVKQRRHYEDGGYSHDFVPVIQGNEVEDYEDFIRLMQSEGLDRYDKLALGTVCKRTDRDEILEVVNLVRDYYPDKHLHLFGATLNIWKDERFFGKFDSSDTAAWNWGASDKEDEKRLLAEYRGKVENYAANADGHTALA